MWNTKNKLEMAPAFHSMMENFDSKKATLKYDRAKFETESRTVLPLLITNEKFAYDWNYCDL